MASPADLRAAIRKADQACPCYLRQRQCGASKPGMLSTGCKCWPSIQQDPRERIADPECIAPGHAAARELARVAAEWAYKFGGLRLEGRDGAFNEHVDSILGPTEG